MMIMKELECMLMYQDSVLSVRQVYFEVKGKKWGATESFSDKNLSLVSGKLGDDGGCK